MTRTGLKAFEALAGGLDKIFPGFRAQLDDTLKRLEEWEKEAKKRADAVAEGFIAADAKTVASSKDTSDQLAEEQRKREELALKAREDALAKIAAAEKKNLKKPRRSARRPVISPQHPSGTTAYPKSSSPSELSWVSSPEAMSRIQRFSSRSNATRLPSGERYLMSSTRGPSAARSSRRN